MSSDTKPSNVLNWLIIFTVASTKDENKIQFLQLFDVS